MNDQTKVLLVSPFKGTVGGISRWTGHILDFYEKQGCNDVYLEQYYGRNEEKHIVHGADSYIKRFIIGICSYIPLIKDVKQKLKTGDYNVIHICSSGSFGLIRDWCLLRIAKHHSIKTIIHFRFGRIPFLLSHNNWESFLLKKVLSQADRIVVLDKATLCALKEYDYADVLLIPNLVSLKLKNVIDKFFPCQRKQRTVLFVGHAIETKGIFELIRAISLMPNTTLRVVGFIPEATKSLARECFVNSTSEIEFVGELPYEETIKEMLSATVFSLPSYSEGFPNVVLEAMACGCSIVATSVGAIPEMLERDASGNEYGLIVAPHNVDELRVALNKMLSDEQFRSNCSDNVRRRVYERYSIGKVWTLLVQLWKE